MEEDRNYHYRISIHAERHRFNLECSTISEAYDAVEDASTMFAFDMDMDEIMIALVNMECKKQTYFERHTISISREKGEV